MPYAIELFLDPAASTFVRSLWRDLAENGISERMYRGGYRPHVTLAVTEDLDLTAARSGIAAFARVSRPLDLCLSSVGLFLTEAAVVYLGVTVTADLLALHTAFTRSLSDYADPPWAYYRPGSWVPHCTLAYALPRDLAGAAVDLLRDLSLPIYAQARQVGLVEVPSGRELVVCTLSEDGV